MNRLQSLFIPVCRAVALVTVLIAPTLPTAIAQDNPPRRAELNRPLPGTQPLTMEGDLAEQMIAGVDRFLLKELAASVTKRQTFWQRDCSSLAAYRQSVEANRQRFAALLGLRDDRPAMAELELVATTSRPALVARSHSYEVFVVRWPALPGVHGEGLLIEPSGAARANLIVLPDCEQLPEQLVGLSPGLAASQQIARRLAESGCRVIVPMLIDRDNELSVIAGGRRRSTATHREILYRSAYQMGRHLIGYEVQKVSAAIDCLMREDPSLPIGVVGYGEGGLLALYTGAVDTRIAVTAVSGYFDSRQHIWQEPIDRNVFGLLREFGDAEIASLIASRHLILEACQGPTSVIPPGTDSAPAELRSAELASVQAEYQRAVDLVKDLPNAAPIQLHVSGDGSGPFGSTAWLQEILKQLGSLELASSGGAPELLAPLHDNRLRRARQFEQLAAFSQNLVDASRFTRAEYLESIDRSNVESFRLSTEPYRSYLRSEIIGAFDRERLPPNPRTLQVYDEPAYRGYEVVLDVYEDVWLYGLLLVPKDLRPGERRAVVVCQHGLEGRAQHTVEGDYTSYRRFAARLAERGFVTFSPQHLYRGGDRFRTLQRKANPLKKSLFSVMVAQHEQLLDWLAQLDFVDSQRIAFYGISYGGKSAMRIPALLDGYCLSICSSDFSDWIWRTVSRRFDSGYLAHGEYEIFEFGLGSHFNYADLAALICPRPFMVEEFHRSGLFAESNRGEFARVQLLYENLGLGERTEITHWPAYQPADPYQERRTFDFLERHLGGIRE